MRKGILAKALSVAVLAAAAQVAFVGPVLSQTAGLQDEARQNFIDKVKGKTVAYLPLALSFDLTQGWLEGLKKELEPLGIKIVVRDANWDSNAGAQALTTIISQKPDVIILHNPDLQTYARLIKRAEDAGIRVIQVNMQSIYPSSVFVGPDWVEVGEDTAREVVGACSGKSKKIAILQGPTSSAPSAYQLRGVENVLKEHPEIQVVSNQAADWDASRAKGITQTVLQQNPDLCGVIGFWDGMDIGAAAAIKEAGLTGKVLLATSGGGEQKGACDQITAGSYDYYYSYDVPAQARSMAEFVKWLLQAGDKAAGAKGVVYSKIMPITKATASSPGTCWKLGEIH